MKRTTVISALLAMLCICSAARPRDFRRVVMWNPWNAGSNVSGIRQDSVSISSAELSARYEAGGLRQSHEASGAFTAAVEANTLMHLEKFSMKGKFSFSHREGKDMCGSMFMEPGFYPFDILEFTPGRKTLQTYSFDGGISVDLGPEWRLGGKAGFISRNCAKRKDLRYTDYRLDLEVSPGILWHRGKWAAGLNYIYARNYETVTAEVIGTIAGSYYAFLDKGMMYGAYGIWNSDGIHLAESGINSFPVKQNLHGVAAQVQYGDFFVEALYKYGKGMAGEKQSCWFDFPEHRAEATALWSTGNEKARHFVRLKFGWKRLSDDENVLETVSEGGVKTTRKYASNRIFESEEWSLSPEYEFVADRWEISAEGNFRQGWEMVSQRYPYLYARNVISWSLRCAGLVRLGHFGISAELDWADGNWKESASRLEGVEGDIDEPYRLTEYVDIQREYETCGKIGVGLGVRYDIFRGLFVEAKGDWRYGCGFSRYGFPQRWAAQLKIGYIF
ncbi:MAG: DUF6850 family outer membrane beta-barrel protein [Candidatus Cryptobacteroides sp.]